MWKAIERHPSEKWGVMREIPPQTGDAIPIPSSSLVK